MTPAFEARLRAVVPGDRLHAGAPLAPLTTFGLGGPADWLVEVRSLDELAALRRCTAEAGVPLVILGGGSNLLVSDAGVRGVVARLRLMAISRSGPGRVRAEAGVTMNGLVRWTVGQGLAGLEAWAGTPGTVGGAIHGNAHFAGRNIGDLVRRAALLGTGGDLAEVDAAALEFAYDRSRLQRTGEILVWAEFEVGPGEPASLREVARRSLAYRKATQPLAAPSAGCVFRNPDPARDRLPPGVPWSAGALVDLAGLKGRRVGGAEVSPAHANFIVAREGATARDVRALIEIARAAVRERFGVDLGEEIVYLGEF